MEQVIQEIYVNVGQPSNLQCVHAMQHDYDSMDILAHIMDKNVPYDISGCDSAQIQGVTANRMMINVSVKSYESNEVIFTLSKNMLASPGIMELSIVFTKDGKKISTFPFTVCVANRPLGQMSKAEIDILEEYVERAKNYYLLSKSFAEGNTGIRTGENTDNSKYYYEQIKKLVSSGGNIGGAGGAKILFYETYTDFKTDYDAGNIEPETLILIAKGNNIQNPSSAIGSRFMAVGDGISCYSLDGKNWVDMTGAESTDIFYDFVYGNNKIVGICLNGKVFYSDNGESWKQCIGLDENLEYVRIAYGNNTFICYGCGSSPKVYYSTNGIEWNECVLPKIINGVSFVDSGATEWGTNSRAGLLNSYATNANLVFYKDKFIFSDVDNIFYSSNGINWDSSTLSIPDQSPSRILILNGKLFFIHPHKFAYSSDGINWNMATYQNLFGNYFYPQCVTYNNNKFLIINIDGTVHTTTDLDSVINGAALFDTYKLQTYDDASGHRNNGGDVFVEYTTMDYKDNQFMLINTHCIGSKYNSIYTSSDGNNWTGIKTDGATWQGYPLLLSCLSHHDNIRVILGQGVLDNNANNKHVIYCSDDDGNTWNKSKEFNPKTTYSMDVKSLKFIDTGV